MTPRRDSPAMLDSPGLMPTAANPLLTLAIVLIAGFVGGLLSKRLGLPSITGQILAGVIVGPAGVALLSEHAVESMYPLADFALGLITVSVGTHLKFPRLRNAGRRLTFLVICESTVTPAVVFLACYYLLGAGWVVATLIAALSVSTAPATTLALVREQRAKGVFSKTLIAAVALNNIACILMFELARVTVGDLLLEEYDHLGMDLIAPFHKLGLAVLLGTVVGGLLVLVVRRLKTRQLITTASLIAILTAFGIARVVGVSELLTCLFMGACLANLAPREEHIGSHAFEQLQHGILAFFFTFAGVGIHLDELGSSGLLVLGVVGARMVGKYLAGFLAMWASGAPSKMRQNIGLALVPQAGVAVGLLLVAKSEPAFSDFSALLVSVGLGSVALNEVVGPIATRQSIRRSGEAGRDRAKLIDFIDEENVIVDFQATDKTDAIRQLCDILIRTNQLKIDKNALLESILEREKQSSTCFGEGLALPHGVLEDGDEMVGAVGISKEGLKLETPDGRPVHCMFLLATPASQRDRHVEVLAALSKSILQEPNLQSMLFGAQTAAEASEILHAEEFAGYNYFLTEEPDEA